MLRRDFVRAVVSASLAPKLLLCQQAVPALPPPAPVPWTLGLNPKTPLPHTEVAEQVAQTKQRFFTAVQMATLIRLSDVLVPQIGDKPGAVQCETPLFLDFLLEASPSARKQVYISGLNWLDATAQQRFQKTFAKLDDEQVGALLKPWLRTWMNDHPPTELHADFVNIAHDDIRTATLNSKAWSDQSAGTRESAGEGLYWYPIEPDIYDINADCTRIPVHVLAAPKSSHTIPAYPR
jgi:gluconate 2-dehydrogenase subunit 3-like protein